MPGTTAELPPAWFLASTWLNVAAFIIKAKLGVLSFVADGASLTPRQVSCSPEHMEGDEDLSIDCPRDRTAGAARHRTVVRYPSTWLGPALVTRAMQAAAAAVGACCLNKRGLSRPSARTGSRTGSEGS